MQGTVFKKVRKGCAHVVGGPSRQARAFGGNFQNPLGDFVETAGFADLQAVRLGVVENLCSFGPFRRNDSDGHHPLSDLFRRARPYLPHKTFKIQ